MENHDQDSFKIINILIRFKNAFFQLWPLTVVLALLLSCYTWYSDKNSFIPMYGSKAIFTVESSYDTEDIFGTGIFYDQYAAQQLASAFPHLISTDMMRDLVLQELDRGYINGSATAVAVADSNMLVLNVTSNNPQDAYDYLCAIMKFYPQIASVMVDNPQVKMVTSPEVPTSSYNSFNALSSIINGALKGIGIGLLIIIICALLTRTIQTTDELKSSINIPLLVALPKVAVKKRRSKNATTITGENDPNMHECLRGLRMKVKKLLNGEKIILVTSTLAGEGKTTVAVNLALSLVQEGHKVLLLDADLRSQSVGPALGEKTEGTSIMECLRHPEKNIFDCIQQCKSYQLDYISGQSIDRRHYSLNIPRFQELLKQLSQRYDYIIIDTPPQDVVSDSAALCRCADCVLYVVKQDYVQRSQVMNTITALHQRGINLSGCIFNGVPKFQRQYGYGYRPGYGYGYDYGYKKHGNRYGYNKYGSKYGSKYSSQYGSYHAALKEHEKRSRRK